MSKLDLPGGQSLEEILASIRQSLADETVGDARGVDGGAAAQPRREAANGAQVNGAAARAADSLPGRLAMALAQSNGLDTEDEDLTDILAPETNGRAGAQTAETPAKSAESRDPLWFLAGRSAAAPQSDAAEVPAARERPAEAKPAAAPVEEVKLTRPEALRRSFPPLFGPGADAAPAADAPADRFGSAERPAEVAAKPAPAPIPEPAPAAVSPLLDARPPFFGEARSEPPPELIVPAEEVPADAKAEAEAEAVETKPASAEADAPAGDAVAAEAGSVPETAALPQSPSLEQMIGQLLEPLLQKWVNDNLPRLVEAAIREEVAQALKGQSGELKI